MQLLADVRYALRMMRKSPLVTLIAVTSLTLGIGANCAMFSVVDFLVFRPLPVADAPKILEVFTGLESGGSGFMSYTEFRDFQDEAESFSKAAVDCEQVDPHRRAGSGVGADRLILRDRVFSSAADARDRDSHVAGRD